MMKSAKIELGLISIVGHWSREFFQPTAKLTGTRLRLRHRGTHPTGSRPFPRPVAVAPTKKNSERATGQSHEMHVPRIDVRTGRGAHRSGFNRDRHHHPSAALDTRMADPHRIHHALRFPHPRHRDHLVPVGHQKTPRPRQHPRRLAIGDSVRSYRPDSASSTPLNSSTESTAPTDQAARFISKMQEPALVARSHGEGGCRRLEAQFLVQLLHPSSIRHKIPIPTCPPLQTKPAFDSRPKAKC